LCAWPASRLRLINAIRYLPVANSRFTEVQRAAGQRALVAFAVAVHDPEIPKVEIVQAALFRLLARAKSWDSSPIQ
jgi:hypothetical protein